MEEYYVGKVKKYLSGCSYYTDNDMYLFCYRGDDLKSSWNFLLLSPQVPTRSSFLTENTIKVENLNRSTASKGDDRHNKRSKKINSYHCKTNTCINTALLRSLN